MLRSRYTKVQSLRASMCGLWLIKYISLSGVSYLGLLRQKPFLFLSLVGDGAKSAL